MVVAGWFSMLNPCDKTDQIWPRSESDGGYVTLSGLPWFMPHFARRGGTLVLVPKFHPDGITVVLQRDL